MQEISTLDWDFRGTKMNEKEAELIGIHTGDGSLYKNKNSRNWEVRGSLDEKDYYNNHIVPLLMDIFKLEFRAKFRSGGANGCYGVQTSKKIVAEFFIKQGFEAKSKLYTGRVQESIFNTNRTCKYAFLRGIFDTDGCIRFDRINKQKYHTYPRVEFGFASEALRDGLAKLISSLGFRCFTWGKRNYSICIAGNKEVAKWFSKVKPANKKHLNRYGLWLRQGYFMPRSHSLAIAVIRKNRMIATRR